jgi:hypothetical protein
MQGLGAAARLLIRAAATAPAGAAAGPSPAAAGRRSAGGVADRARSATDSAFASLPPSARRVAERLGHLGALRRAAVLQAEAAWQRHGGKAAAAVTLLGAYAAWRVASAAAGALVDLRERRGVRLALGAGAAGLALGAALLVRRRLTLSPEAARRAAMLRLNSHPGILEVLGAPVVGSSRVFAAVASGGGLRLRGARPGLRSRRLRMAFPVAGSESRALASLEARRRRGRLELTLLAVDVPLPAALGGEQRVYVVGGPAAYARGGVLDELRRPLLAALEAENADAAAEAAEDEAVARRAAFDIKAGGPVAVRSGGEPGALVQLAAAARGVAGRLRGSS